VDYIKIKPEGMNRLFWFNYKLGKVGSGGKVKGIGLIDDLGPFKVVWLKDGCTDKIALALLEGVDSEINEVLFHTSFKSNFY